MITPPQFHIRIMKFRQHFTIAIITPTDGFTHISISFANQVNSQQKPLHADRAYKMRGTIMAQKTVPGMEFFRGKALALQTLKQITTLATEF